MALIKTNIQKAWEIQDIHQIILVFVVLHRDPSCAKLNWMIVNEIIGYHAYLLFHKGCKPDEVASEDTYATSLFQNSEFNRWDLNPSVK